MKALVVEALLPDERRRGLARLFEHRFRKALGQVELPNHTLQFDFRLPLGAQNLRDHALGQLIALRIFENLHHDLVILGGVLLGAGIRADARGLSSEPR